MTIQFESKTELSYNIFNFSDTDFPQIWGEYCDENSIIGLKLTNVKPEKSCLINFIRNGNKILPKNTGHYFYLIFKNELKKELSEDFLINYTFIDTVSSPSDYWDSIINQFLSLPCYTLKTTVEKFNKVFNEYKFSPIVKENNMTFIQFLNYKKITF